MKIGKQVTTDGQCAEKEEIQRSVEGDETTDEEVEVDWDEESLSDIIKALETGAETVFAPMAEALIELCPAVDMEDDRLTDLAAARDIYKKIAKAYKRKGDPSRLEIMLMDVVINIFPTMGKLVLSYEELETQVQEDDHTQEETGSIVEEEAKTVAEIKESVVEPIDDKEEDRKPMMQTEQAPTPPPTMPTKEDLQPEVLEILTEDEPTAHAMPAKEVYKPPQRRKDQGSQPPEMSSSSSSGSSRTRDGAKRKKKHTTNRRSNLANQQWEDRSHAQGSRNRRYEDSSGNSSSSSRSWRKQDSDTKRRYNSDDRSRRRSDSDGYRSGSDSDRSRYNRNRSRYSSDSSRYSSMSDDRRYRSSNRSYHGGYYAEGSQGRRNSYDRRCRGYSTDTTHRRGDWRNDADQYSRQEEDKLKQYLYRIIQYVVDAL